MNQCWNHPLTHLHRAIVVLRNRFRFEVTLQISIKIILQELLQGLSIATADTKEIDFIFSNLKQDSLCKQNETYENSSLMTYLSPLAVRMPTRGSSPLLPSRPSSDTSWLKLFLLATAKLSVLPWSRKLLATFITLQRDTRIIRAWPRSTLALHSNKRNDIWE